MTAEGAIGEHGTVNGAPPANNLEEHVTRYRSATLGYDAIVYTGSGLAGREIEGVRKPVRRASFARTETMPPFGGVSVLAVTALIETY